MGSDPLDPAAGPLDREPLRFLIGPTAAGKSDHALALAERAGAEIVSLDSMLVYRGMDVGTAKPGAAERARVPHHLIDLVEPCERYDLRRYLADAEAALGAILEAGGRALFVGGTGLYLKALVHGLFDGPPADPELRRALRERARAKGASALHAELARVDPPSAGRIHPHDERRVVRALEVLEQTGRTLSAWQTEWGWHGSAPRVRAHRILGLAREPAELEERIVRRTRAMLDGGWPEEVRRIRDGGGFGPSSIQALGYREVLALVEGDLTEAECAERVALRTRQFARRQRTWFRRFDVDWIPAETDPGEAAGRLGWTASAGSGS